jgi:hypothetical protein
MLCRWSCTGEGVTYGLRGQILALDGAHQVLLELGQIHSLLFLWLIYNMGQAEHTGLVILVLSLLLSVYVLLKAVIEHKRWHFLSHTSIAILLGMSVGALFFFIT